MTAMFYSVQVTETPYSRSRFHSIAPTMRCCVNTNNSCHYSAYLKKVNIHTRHVIIYAIISYTFSSATKNSCLFKNCRFISHTHRALFGIRTTNDIVLFDIIFVRQNVNNNHTTRSASENRPYIGVISNPKQKMRRMLCDFLCVFIKQNAKLKELNEDVPHMLT